MKYFSIFLLSFSVFVLGMPFIASADTCASFDTTGSSAFNFGQSSGGSYAEASAFTTGASDSCELSAIGVRIKLHTVSTSGDVFLELWSSTGSLPSVKLATGSTISNASLSTSFGWATSTFSGVTLDPSTEYWIAYQSTSHDDSNDFISDGAFSGSAAYSSNGSSWSADGSRTGTFYAEGTLTPSGGGGGSSTTTNDVCTYLYGSTSTPCVQILDNPTTDLGFGMLLFISSFWGTIWFFRKRGN